MNTMKQHIIILSFFLMAPMALMAQKTVTSEEHQLTTVVNPWLSTDNAAGLASSSYTDHAQASLGVETSSGDYHRAQEGNRINKLIFSAESYNRLSKNWIAWGSFNFNMQREKERAWSDVIDTYNSSPYIFGSSIKGKYDTQMFDLHFKLARPTKGIASYGVTVDYKVADMSRLRDPRSRTQLADYCLRPSVVLSLGSHSNIGVTGAYRWKKEKLPNITTVQEDPNILYYNMLGMEFATATVAGFKGFKRQFVSAYWGGDVQYSLHNTADMFLLSAGAMFEDQKIEDDTKETPGNFKAYHINIDGFYNHQTEKTLFSANWKNYYKRGHANENLQELISTTDPSTGVSSKQWNTIYTYNDRYRVIQYRSDIDISLRGHEAQSKDYSWLVGLKGGINGFQQAYRMPTSTNDVKIGKIGAYGSARLYNKDSRSLRLNLHANYSFNIKNDLKMAASSLQPLTSSSSTFETGTYNYATNVMEADKAYFDAKTAEWGIDAQYNFALKMKSSKLNAFFKAYYSNLHASDSMGSWNGGGVCFGVIL